MSKYVENTLEVTGEPKILKYFYERNRISEEDVQMLGLDEDDIKVLSFKKCIPRIQKNIFIDFVNDNFLPKNIPKNNDIDVLHEIFPLMIMNNINNLFWSTNSDTINPSCYLIPIEDGMISYSFGTVGSFPKNWLISISKIFKYLNFKITYSKRDDGYNIHYVYEYTNGIETKITEYNKYNNSDSEPES